MSPLFGRAVVKPLLGPSFSLSDRHIASAVPAAARDHCHFAADGFRFCWLLALEHAIDRVVELLLLIGPRLCKELIHPLPFALSPLFPAACKQRSPLIVAQACQPLAELIAQLVALGFGQIAAGKHLVAHLLQLSDLRIGAAEEAKSPGRHDSQYQDHRSDHRVTHVHIVFSQSFAISLAIRNSPKPASL